MFLMFYDYDMRLDVMYAFFFDCFGCTECVSLSLDVFLYPWMCSWMCSCVSDLMCSVWMFALCCVLADVFSMGVSLVVWLGVSSHALCFGCVPTLLCAPWICSTYLSFICMDSGGAFGLGIALCSLCLRGSVGGCKLQLHLLCSLFLCVSFFVPIPFITLLLGATFMLVSLSFVSIVCLLSPLSLFCVSCCYGQPLYCPSFVVSHVYSL
jgi:hypothetical protein